LGMDYVDVFCAVVILFVFAPPDPPKPATTAKTPSSGVVVRRNDRPVVTKEKCQLGDVSWLQLNFTSHRSERPATAPDSGPKKASERSSSEHTVGIRSWDFGQLVIGSSWVGTGCDHGTRRRGSQSSPPLAQTCGRRPGGNQLYYPRAAAHDIPSDDGKEKYSWMREPAQHLLRC
jgi:hypothetical protein